MHEVEMMQNILDAAIQRAKDENAQHIRLVQMRVGEASGVVLDSLQLAFDTTKKGTMAEDAKVEFENVPIVCHCSNCGIEFHPINELYECPECHKAYCEMRQGAECEIAFLEVS